MFLRGDYGTENCTIAAIHIAFHHLNHSGVEQKCYILWPIQTQYCKKNTHKVISIMWWLEDRIMVVNIEASKYILVDCETKGIILYLLVSTT